MEKNMVMITLIYIKKTILANQKKADDEALIEEIE